MLLGPPASGKGTLADALHHRFGWPVASPGAMLRAEKTAGTALGIEADRLTRDGRLVSDTIINQVVELWLSHEADHGFIFDGYPRTVGQADALDQMLAKRNGQLDAALLLEADLSTLRDRVERRATCSVCGCIVSVGVHVDNFANACPRCGSPLKRRADDNFATLQNRLEEYRDKTLPVAGYYEKRGLLHRVSTQRPVGEVVEDVLQILN